jgi:acyl carrier protein
MNQMGVEDRRRIDSTALAALSSMSAVGGPLSREVLLADVEIDSLDLVELTQILEEECDLEISAGDFSDAVRVGDVIDVLRSHRR